MPSDKEVLTMSERFKVTKTKSEEPAGKTYKNYGATSAENDLELKGKLLPDSGANLQKKWRNIRDCFVKVYRAKQTKTGSAAKKKVSYSFYDNLLFLKDVITTTTPKSNVSHTNGRSHLNENSKEESRNFRKRKIVREPIKKSVVNNDSEIRKELIVMLKKNLERQNTVDDDDKLFFLSLVNEFKKIPDNLKMQTKIDILNIINDAQPSTSGDELNCIVKSEFD